MEVSRKEWQFPTFSSECPICGGSDCCVRIGYYYRYVLVLDEGTILSIPIARFLCKRKKKPKLKDRTFSLLPNCLIPYVQATIKTLMQVINGKLIKKQTDLELLNTFYLSIYDARLNISIETLANYFELFEQIGQKIKTLLKDLEKDHPHFQQLHTLEDSYHFLTDFRDTQYGKGPKACAQWYHELLGGFKMNAYFLFGTPYQFRY